MSGANEACTGTVSGQIAVNKTGQFCSILHKNRWKFKGRTEDHSVRDEGVVGSNPITPTTLLRFQTSVPNFSPNFSASFAVRPKTKREAEEAWQETTPAKVRAHGPSSR